MPFEPNCSESSSLSSSTNLHIARIELTFDNSKNGNFRSFHYSSWKLELASKPKRKKIKVFDLIGRRLSSLWKENPQLIPIDAVMLVYYDSICFMSLSRFLFSVYESVLLLVVLRTYPGPGQQMKMTRITSSSRRWFIAEHISVCISMLIVKCCSKKREIGWLWTNLDISICCLLNTLLPWSDDSIHALILKLSWRCQDRG